MAGGLGNIGSAFVTVELDFDNAVRDAKEAGAKIPPVELRAELDQSQVTREVKTTLDSAERAAGPLTPRAEMNQAQVTGEVKSTLAKAAAAAGAIPVRVNKASLAAATAQIRTAFTGAFTAAGAAARTAFIPGVLGAVVLGDQIRRGAADAKELEGALTGVRASLKGAGKESGVTERQIRNVASSFETFSSISEESIIAAQEPLTRFGVVSKKTMPEITRLMLDTAVGMRQVSEDGEIAGGFAQKFARALADPVKGLTLLSKAGVPVSATLKDNVKDLVATGKQAEATALVADLLREKYTGAAKELGESVPGQLRLATDAFEDSRRNLAQRILPAIAAPIRTLSEAIASSLDKNRVGIANFVVGVVRGVGRLVKFITTNKEFHAVMRGLAAVVKGVARGLRGFIAGFAKAFSKKQSGGAKSFGETMENLGKRIGELAEKWLPIVGGALGTFFGVITRTKAGIAALFAFLASSKVLGVLRTVKLAFSGVGLILRGLAFVVGAFVAVFGAIPVAIGAAIAVLVVLYAKFKIVRKVVNSLIPIFAQLVLGPLAGLAAAFVLVWKRSERFRDVVRGAANAVRGAITSLRTKFAEWRAGMAVILDAARAKFASWRDAVSGMLKTVRERVTGWVADIKAKFANLSLFSFGKKIIRSLLDGMIEGWKEVKTWLSERAQIIRDLKGPLGKDKTLLFREGDAIMGGFFRGLTSRWKGIAGWLGGIGGYFKGVISGDKFDFGKILLGEATVGDLNKQLSGALDIPWMGPGAFGGLGGFLAPTTGWGDTLRQVGILERMFGPNMTSGFRPGATTSSGSVSQHALGQAADFGTSGATTEQLNRLAAFASKMRSVFRQVIWLNRLWEGGFPTSTVIPDHMDHVHLGWQARAGGGGVRKGRGYQWNERGAEMFVPHGNGYVMNAGRTKELVGALKDLAKRPTQNSSRSAEIHVHSNAVDPAAVGSVVMSNLGAVFSRA